jgi:hypothetical protein
MKAITSKASMCPMIGKTRRSLDPPASTAGMDIRTQPGRRAGRENAPGGDPGGVRWWLVAGLPRGPFGPRVGVARVGSRLGQRAGDGNQEDGDQEFHDGILRQAVDNSNRMWSDK